MRRKRRLQPLRLATRHDARRLRCHCHDTGVRHAGHTTPPDGRRLDQPLTDNRFIVLAKIGAASGVKGDVRVKSFTADPTALGGYGSLVAEDGRVFEIARLRPAGGMLVVKFRGIDSRNAAEALNGTLMGVPRNALPEPEPEEFYHADLTGLDAFDPAGRALGAVTAVLNHGAGDFLEIAPREGKTLLIPFTRQAVPEIDIARGRLTIVLPIEIEVPGDTGNEEGSA